MHLLPVCVGRSARVRELTPAEEPRAPLLPGSGLTLTQLAGSWEGGRLSPGRSWSLGVGVGPSRGRPSTRRGGRIGSHCSWLCLGHTYSSATFLGCPTGSAEWPVPGGPAGERTKGNAWGHDLFSRNRELGARPLEKQEGEALRPVPLGRKARPGQSLGTEGAQCTPRGIWRQKEGQVPAHLGPICREDAQLWQSNAGHHWCPILPTHPPTAGVSPPHTPTHSWGAPSPHTHHSLGRASPSGLYRWPNLVLTLLLERLRALAAISLSASGPPLQAWLPAERRCSLSPHSALAWPVGEEIQGPRITAGAVTSFLASVLGREEPDDDDKCVGEAGE